MPRPPLWAAAGQVENGDLLRRMRGEYDALLTMDQGIEFQQNVATLPFGVLLLLALPTEWRISSHSFPGSLLRSQNSGPANSRPIGG